MSRRLWLLVEWIDENNVFPVYGVIHVDIFSYKESELQPGQQIFISLKHDDPQRAKVIRISDNKRQVKEHRDFLERQDKQVKNVLQLCMRTIKEMKSDQYSSSLENSQQLNVTGQQSSAPHVITAKSENSASDSDVEIHSRARQSKIANYINQTHHQTTRYEPNSNNSYRKKGRPSPAPRRRSIISSTPLPGKHVQDYIKLYIDKGTQTENNWKPPTTAKIEEVELVLKHLYGRFQSLVMRVNSSNNGNQETSESEQNGENCNAEPNESWLASNAVAESLGMDNDAEDSKVIMCDIEAQQKEETKNERGDIKIATVNMVAGRQNSNDSTRVRRMSAHTTANEMVPIGSGHAMIPARMLNEIDWSSHTTATRQLLQAIFPRKVLATHSLTGRPSPAYLNKPVKKLLDPNVVDDIVMTVSSKSGVPKNLVRNTITIKCTDEAKLYRNRQKYRFSRNEKSHQNNENVPPPIIMHSSDDSLN